MKATLKNSFAKRSIVIAATTLPALCVSVASAQEAPPPAPPVAPVAAPAPPPPAAPPPPEATGAVVTGPASETPPAPATVPPPVPPAPTDPDAEKYKHINMGVWMRVGAALQKGPNEDAKKLGGIGVGATVELHMSNQMRKDIQWTANFIGTLGAPDGGSFAGGPGTGPSSSVAVLDAIAQYEPTPAFNFWVGRMLVASDRSNFSGPWFMAPWVYPLFLGAQGQPFAVVGPKEGPFGRNDGATVWGQFAGGTFKYYLGAYNIYHAQAKPLISGRLNLSLLNPEPGFYSSSTYYGMDILAIGVGGQYQKNGDANLDGSGALSDYGMFNADILFEKNLAASGVFDVEGAFYKYIGDGQVYKQSYMALVSYVLPETPVGKFQPLVRIQQVMQKNDLPTGTMVDAQVGYIVDNYATRFALGYSHGKMGDVASNAVFAGVQLQK